MLESKPSEKGLSPSLDKGRAGEGFAFDSGEGNRSDPGLTH